MVIDTTTNDGICASGSTGHAISIDDSGTSITSLFTGVTARTYSGDVSIVNDAVINAGLGGVLAVAQTTGGDIAVKNYADITATTYGMSLTTQNGSISAYELGNISVSNNSGTAYGIHSISFGAGNTSVDVVGDITVSASGNASGVHSFDRGDMSVTIDGDVNVTSSGGVARGVYAASTGLYDTETMTITGNVSVHGDTGAYGVSAFAPSDETVVNISGSVSATSASGYTAAIRANGIDTRIYVGGNVTAMTTSGNATGVQVGSNNYTKVVLQGSVYVANTGVRRPAFRRAASTATATPESAAT